MAVKHIKTTTGFEADIDDSCIDDMELFDAVIELQSGDATAIPTVVQKLGGVHKKALYDHCRLPDGRVPIQAICEEIAEIFNALNAKN